MRNTCQDTFKAASPIITFEILTNTTTPQILFEIQRYPKQLLFPKNYIFDSNIT